jgi:hypothetical protein
MLIGPIPRLACHIVADDNAFEMLVTPEFDKLGAGMQSDIRRFFNAPDQISRHRARKAVRSNEDMNMCSKSREENRINAATA